MSFLCENCMKASIPEFRTNHKDACDESSCVLKEHRRSCSTCRRIRRSRRPSPYRYCGKLMNMKRSILAKSVAETMSSDPIFPHFSGRLKVWMSRMFFAHFHAQSYGSADVPTKNVSLKDLMDYYWNIVADSDVIEAIVEVYPMLHCCDEKCRSDTEGCLYRNKTGGLCSQRPAVLKPHDEHWEFFYIDPKEYVELL